MFEVMIIKRGRSRWEWRVCDRDGAILIHGWESTRRAAKYRGDLRAIPAVGCRAL